MLFAQSYAGLKSFSERKKLEREKQKKDDGEISKNRSTSIAQAGQDPAKPNKLTLAQVKYSDREPDVLAADRTVMNTMEQSLVFLPLFWLNILYVLAPEKFEFFGYVQQDNSAFQQVCQNRLFAPLQSMNVNTIGIVWMALRSYFYYTFHKLPSMFPAALGRGRGFVLHLMCCTVPSYVCVTLLLMKIACVAI